MPRKADEDPLLRALHRSSREARKAAPAIRTSRAIRAGDYVLIVEGVDDVADAQLCQVLGPNEERPGPGCDDVAYEDEGDEESVPVLCWTGYVCWTRFGNLVPVQGDAEKLGEIMTEGNHRVGDMKIVF